MPSEKTDEEIIVLYKDNEQEALKILINRYTSALYNFVARLTNRNEAGDIVQEVFIKTWKNIHHFDPKKASFKTWIFTIAKNTTTDFLRISILSLLIFLPKIYYRIWLCKNWKTINF